MIPMHERLRINQHSLDEGITADSILVNGRTTMNPKLLLIPDELADRAEPLTKEHVRGLRYMISPEQQAAEEALNESIRQRAAADSQLADDLFGSDSDSLPELVSLAGQTSSTDDSISLGICGLCFEEQHTATADCPLHGPGPRTSAQVNDNLIGEFRKNNAYQTLKLGRGPSDIPERNQEM
jgi:hypothetical protein